MMKRLIPLTLFAICVGLCGVLCWVLPNGKLLGHPARYAGAVPILFGWVLTVTALHKLRKRRTTCAAFREPVRLVTTGVYRYTRNPIYLGLALVIAGGCIFMGASCLLVPVLLFVIVVDRWVIRVEERMLVQKFGQKFQGYQSQTPRWI